MFKYQESVTLAKDIKTVYNIAKDIESYPKFIPWCSNAKKLKTDEEGWHYFELELSFKIFTKSFTTKDKFTPYEKIEIILVEGPFKSLNSMWIFEDISSNTNNSSSSTKVNFSIEFDFNNKLFSKMFGPVFLNANKKILQSFINRALNERDI